MPHHYLYGVVVGACSTVQIRPLLLIRGRSLTTKPKCLAQKIKLPVTLSGKKEPLACIAVRRVFTLAIQSMPSRRTVLAIARTKRKWYWPLLRLGKNLRYEDKFQAIIPKTAKSETRGNQDETLTPAVTVKDSTPLRMEYCGRAWGIGWIGRPEILLRSRG